MSKITKLIRKLCPEGVEYYKLVDAFKIKNGYTPSKNKEEYWKNGTIPWFRMDDIRKNGRILSDSIQCTTPQALKGGKLFPAGSIIMSTTATIGEHALITVDALANQRFTVLTRKSDYLNKIDTKFFFYYCFVLTQWCRNNTNTSGFASVNMEKFKKLKIPVPPLEVQHEIVRILDSFSKLEAELAARRKQYEYYRDKLLSFEELEP